MRLKGFGKVVCKYASYIPIRVYPFTISVSQYSWRITYTNKVFGSLPERTVFCRE